MRIFMTQGFHHWATKEGLTQSALRTAVEEIKRGLIDASLGGGVIKKRIALHGRGKRGGVRALLAFKQHGHIFFIYGFVKNQRATINPVELSALKRLAKHLFSFGDKELAQALKTDKLIEVAGNGEAQD